MSENFIRDIFYYERHYLDFFKELKPEVKKKFNWTLQLIATIDRVPEKYFKHMTNSTWEPDYLVNGFKKTTQKTPKNELALAEKLKKQYFDEQRDSK